MNIKGFNMSLNNGTLPDGIVKTKFEGPVEVSGQITAHFMVDGKRLRRFWQQHVNGFLRQVRPFMSKRRWRRLRGKVKGQGR